MLNKYKKLNNKEVMTVLNALGEYETKLRDTLSGLNKNDFIDDDTYRTLYISVSSKLDEIKELKNKLND